MELHQLRYFVALAKTGNFSRAAELCHITQPSLSQQIKKLEDELDEALLVRRKNKARTTLTEAGEVLLHHANTILSEVDSAHRAIEDLGSLTRGSVRLGVIPTIAPYLLPEIISSFQTEHPNLRLEINEEPTDALLSALRQSEVQIALLSLPVAGDFQVESLYEEELLLCLPSGHALEEKATVSLADIHDEPFIMMHQDHCLSAQIEHLCHRQDILLNVAFRSSQLETIKSFIRSHMGISLIPRMAIDPVQDANQSLVYRQLSPSVKREIAVLYNRDQPLSKAAHAFLTFLSRELRPNDAADSRRAC